MPDKTAFAALKNLKVAQSGLYAQLLSCASLPLSRFILPNGDCKFFDRYASLVLLPGILQGRCGRPGVCFGGGGGFFRMLLERTSGVLY